MDSDERVAAFFWVGRWVGGRVGVYIDKLIDRQGVNREGKEQPSSHSQRTKPLNQSMNPFPFASFFPSLSQPTLLLLLPRQRLAL